jgi:hypothetical protein
MTQLLWRLLQLSIIAAVVCWMIYMGFDHGGLSTGLIAVGVAWLLTTFPLIVWLWFVRRRNRGAPIIPGARRRSGVVGRDKTPQRDLDLLGPQ